MNPTPPPATDKVKTCCTSLTCGKVLLVNAARWKEGLSCPLCKKGTLVKLESTKTPMVPVVPVRVVASPKPVAPARIDAVPVVPVRVIPDPGQAKLAELPRSDGVPVVAVRHIPDTAPTAEWLPASATVAVATPPAPPDPVPTAPAAPVPMVILAEPLPATAPTAAPAQDVPAVILMGELVEEGAAAPEGTYGMENLRTPPKCPKCKLHLKPNTERCPECGFDFRGDWERRLLDQNKMTQALEEEKRRQDAQNAAMEQHEQEQRLNELGDAAYFGGLWV